jgi:DNA-binding transcriptional regulator YdaS (Cro superfamily)
MKDRGSPSQRTIERALENVGDRERLAEVLGVDIADLNRWILGKQLPPHEVFLRALDLAFQATSPVVPRPPYEKHAAATSTSQEKSDK